MTWTRLFYVNNIQKAFKRVTPGLPRQQLAISKRYQAQIKKLFRLNSVPWLYDVDKQVKQNPRDKKPKPKKRVALRQIRLQKIQKALLESPKKIQEFRQSRLDGRPLGGIDKLISKALPSWIKQGEGKKTKRKNRQLDQEEL